jgi:hypothetical protein
METTIEKQYVITFDQCKTLINGVCDGCGGQLEPIETVDNGDNPTFWSHCPACSKYHWGTPEYIFKIAEQMVDKKGYKPYRHMNEKDYQYRQSQISGTCYLVRDVLTLFEEMKTK